MRYYKSHSSPILIVIYSVSENIFWGLWSNLLVDSVKTKTNQKKVLYKFGGKHRIDTQFFKNLENSFDKNIYNKINLSSSSDSDLAASFHDRVCKWIKLIYPDTFEFDNFTLATNLHLTYKSNNSNLGLQIKYKSLSLQLDEINLSDKSFIYHPIIDPSQIYPDELEVLFFLTKQFFEYSPINSVKLLSEIIPQYNGKLKTDLVLCEIGYLYVVNKSQPELEILIQNLLKNKLFNEIQCLDIPMIGLAKKFETLTLHISIQKALLDSIEEPKSQATYHYNLGNAYHQAGLTNLSFFHYNKARKLNPEYLNRRYWWREMAGTLFLAKRYTISASFYETFIDLLEGDPAIPFFMALMADCYFMSGKFTSANFLYSHYVSKLEDSKPISEFVLKKLVSEDQLKHNLDNILIDRSRSDSLCKEAFEKNNELLYNESIKQNPLNGFAWFSYGLYLTTENRTEDALWAFLKSAVFSETSRSSWVYCFLAAWNIKNNDLSYFVLDCIINKYGQAILIDITEVIMKQSDMSIENKKSIIATFTKLGGVIERDKFPEYFSMNSVHFELRTI